MAAAQHARGNAHPDWGPCKVALGWVQRLRLSHVRPSPPSLLPVARSQPQLSLTVPEAQSGGKRGGQGKRMIGPSRPSQQAREPSRGRCAPHSPALHSWSEVVKCQREQVKGKLVSGNGDTFATNNTTPTIGPGLSAVGTRETTKGTGEPAPDWVGVSCQHCPFGKPPFAHL